MANERRKDETLWAQIEKSLTMTRPAEIGACIFLAVFGLGLGALQLLRLADDFEGYFVGGGFCAVGLLGIVHGIEVVRRDERHVTSMILGGACTLAMGGLGFLFLAGPHDYFMFAACGAMALAGLGLIVQAIRRATRSPREQRASENSTPAPPP